VHVIVQPACTDVTTDEKGEAIELKATIHWTKEIKKGLGFIQWVAEPTPGKEPLVVELRLYEPLFKSDQPAAVDNWEADLNPNSEIVLPSCFADPSIKDLKVEDKVQLERLGYFCVDSDSTKEKVVLNRIVSLKATEWEGN